MGWVVSWVSFVVKEAQNIIAILLSQVDSNKTFQLCAQVDFINAP